MPWGKACRSPKRWMLIIIIQPRAPECMSVISADVWWGTPVYHYQLCSCTRSLSNTWWVYIIRKIIHHPPTVSRSYLFLVCLHVVHRTRPLAAVHERCEISVLVWTHWLFFSLRNRVYPRSRPWMCTWFVFSLFVDASVYALALV